MIIEMKRRDHGHKNEPWKLDLREKAVLIGPDGNTVAEFEPKEVIACFQIPWIGGDTHDFRVQVGDDLLAFAVCKSDLRQIDRFLNRALVASGPDVVATVWKVAVRNIALGLLCTIAGFGISFLSYRHAASNPRGGRYTIFYGLAIFGAFVLARGIVLLGRYGKLQRLSREAPGPGQTDWTLAGATTGGVRNPQMKVVVASLLVIAGLGAFAMWRALGSGAPPAQALAKDQRASGALPEGQPPRQAQLPPPPRVPLMNANEEPDTIEGLRACARFTGSYPEALDAQLSDIARQVRDNPTVEAPHVALDAGPDKTTGEKVQCIHWLHAFYFVLSTGGKDAAYYGKVVKPGEADRVLLRWRIAPKEYRVIFGDLHAETVTAERLAQLEAAQAPVSDPQVQPNTPASSARTSASAMVPFLRGESDAIAGLRDCASLLHRYPESLDATDDRLKEDIRRLREDAKSKTQGFRLGLEEMILHINRFGTFGKTLCEQKREPVYYGRVVKPGAATCVLLRWQLAPNEYRVIYGNLRAETVTAERLAQLEAMLPK